MTENVKCRVCGLPALCFYPIDYTGLVYQCVVIDEETMQYDHRYFHTYPQPGKMCKKTDMLSEDWDAV